jgi:hypothetical protein
MPNGHGFSFPYGVPLVIYPALAIGIASSLWWSIACTALAAVMAVLAAREGFSRAEYESVHAKDPSMNLLTWRINWLVFFALPAAVLAFFGVARHFL